MVKKTKTAKRGKKVSNAKKTKKVNKEVVEGKPEAPVSKKVQDLETKQLIWFFGVIGLVFILFFGTYYFVQAQKHFNYGGAEWWIEGEKEGWGDITFYHGRYPVETLSGKLITNMNLWLRNDPRHNNIPSNVDFSSGIAKEVIISFTEDLMECPNRVLVVPQLAQAFGAGLPWTTVSGAVANRSMADDLNLSFADCTSVDRDTTVILIQKGSESRVYSDNECYIVQYGNCDEAVKASEKIVLELIRQMAS